MAYSEVCAMTRKREQSNVYDIDQCYRYEIISAIPGKVMGVLYLRKTEVDDGGCELTAFTLTA